MSEVFTVIAVSLGFIAGGLFCSNAASTSAKLIYDQSGIPWEYNSAVAESLTSQHAQYFVGAVFLVGSFAFQAAAILTPQVTAYPSWLPQGILLFVCILVPLSLLAWLWVKVRIKNIKSQLVHIHEEEHARIAALDSQKRAQ